MEGSEEMAKKKKKFIPTEFMAEGSHYDEDQADYVVNFIQCLCHTKGKWAGKPFLLLPWQEEIIRNCKCQYKNVGFISYKRVGKPTCLYDIF